MAQLDRATVCGTVGRRFESSWAHQFFGEMAEWSKAVDSKSAVPYGYRGFESHSLLQRNAGLNFAERYRRDKSLGAIHGLKLPAAVRRLLPGGGAC